MIGSVTRLVNAGVNLLKVEVLVRFPMTQID